MKKWTTKEVNQLRKLAESGTPNGDIAKALNRPITEIYAKRSQLGITIDKVKAGTKAADPKQDNPAKAVPQSIVAARVHDILAKAETPEERCRLVQRIRTEAFTRMVFGEIGTGEAESILAAVKAEVLKYECL